MDAPSTFCSAQTLPMKIPLEAPKLGERRDKRRLALEREVSLNSETNFYVGVTENVSQGGLFIRTEQKLSVGQRVGLSLTLSEGGEHIECVGEVRWIQPGSDPPGYGLRFTNLTPETREAIDKFIAHRKPIYHPAS